MPSATIITPMHPLEAAKRRDVLKTLLALPLVAACAGPGARPTPAAQTRRHTDGTGRVVEIPDQARRIVALHDNQIGAPLLSIGAPVVGLPTTGGQFSDFLKGYDLAGIQGIGDLQALDIEAIAGLKPDLIIGHAYDGKPVPTPEVASRLEQLAPTVWVDPRQPVDAVMAAFGAITGRVAEVERQRGEWEAEVRRVRATLPSGLSAAFVSYPSPNLFTFAPNMNLSVPRVLDALGLRVPPVVAAGVQAGQVSIAVSPERVRELDADLIFWHGGASDPAQIPLWPQLAAARAGQVFKVAPSAVGNVSYVSFRRTLAALEPILAQAKADVVDEAGW